MLLKRLLLVRHGETEWNRTGRIQGHTDIPLNERGHDQARRLAARLEGWEVDALYTSDLQRARQTADALRAALKVDPVPAPAWREISFGALDGSATAAREHGEAITACVRAGGPLGEGGESFQDFQARIVADYDRIRAQHAEETVAIVSHGGTLKTLIAHLLELDPLRIDRLSLRGNTGLSIFDFRHSRPQLVLLNCTRHLE